MFTSGRIHDPANLFHSPSCFAAFEPWPTLISAVPTMPVASLLPAQLETAISTVRVELVYQTMTTGRCQLQNGVLLSQSGSCQNSGWMSSTTTLRGRRKITEIIAIILLGDYGRSV